jgi:hypothetical protein
VPPASRRQPHDFQWYARCQSFRITLVGAAGFISTFDFSISSTPFPFAPFARPSSSLWPFRKGKFNLCANFAQGEDQKMNIEANFRSRPNKINSTTYAICNANPIFQRAAGVSPASPRLPMVRTVPVIQDHSCRGCWIYFHLSQSE